MFLVQEYLIDTLWLVCFYTYYLYITLLAREANLEKVAKTNCKVYPILMVDTIKSRIKQGTRITLRIWTSPPPFPPRKSVAALRSQTKNVAPDGLASL